jgi:hypothetical protein
MPAASVTPSRGNVDQQAHPPHGASGTTIETLILAPVVDLHRGPVTVPIVSSRKAMTAAITTMVVARMPAVLMAEQRHQEPGRRPRGSNKRLLLRQATVDMVVMLAMVHHLACRLLPDFLHLPVPQDSMLRLVSAGMSTL